MPAILLIKAAAFYFAFSFACGFLLGTLRVLLVAPYLGALAATALEIPLMLAASWFSCQFILKKWAIPLRPMAGIAIGVLAFVFLISAETALGFFVFERSLNEQLSSYAELPSQIGLAAQIAFAAFPWLQIYLKKKES